MIDKLIKKIDDLKNPSVIGLDPTIEMIPNFILNEMYEKYGETPEAIGEAFLTFNKCIIDSIYDLVPAVKPQIAMYEKFGIQGLIAYIETIKYAKEKGLIVIGDIKRGDISSTAEAYSSHIGGTKIMDRSFDLWKEEFITVNPYLGSDGITPFIDACNKSNRGIFILVKTSNPSSSEIQDLIVDNEKIYEKVAKLVNKWGEASMGENGFSRVGAVVGATHKEVGAKLRKIMPNSFFLVPGYGAQGGKASDLSGFFDKDKRGCIVNSSRGITGAYKQNIKFDEKEFALAAREAVLEMKRDFNYVY